MKTISHFLYVFAISVFTGWLSAGCSQGTTEANPQSTCRIQQYNAVSKSALSNTVSQTTYEYDQLGKLTKTVTTFTKQSTPATNQQTSTTTVLYSYNAEGYLTAMNSQLTTITTTAGKTITEKVSMANSYSYTNGRLSSASKRTVGAYGLNTTVSELYEYDGTGALVTKTAQTHYDYDPTITHEIPGNPTGPLQIWTYQQNVLIDYVEKSGTLVSRPITIQNGLATSITIPDNYKVSWEYDNQQRQIKLAEYVNDTLTRTTSQTWSNAKPAIASLPVFKGFPVTAPASEFGQVGVLATSTYVYWNSVSKKMETFSAQTSLSQTNTQGYVTNVTTVVKHPIAADQDETTTETYTYSGCQ
ncbi:hypothetical protein GO730_19265 [Spirosoma sp. HMF3257]|uniref:YD repeat-containing protein n=1 Tax=Spirosoma telluris TaxID=2183553 RepID=A0A327NSN3_9BACT|nr:hypothetical protein [Spirosoma telluris]RAI75748.1 hypothetical protein HMF3257_19195 [Spirosoma telluris]